MFRVARCQPFVRLGRSYLSSLTSVSASGDELMHGPLTSFTEDEEMTREAARHWAQEHLKPLVRDMDNEGKLRPDVVQSLFDLGFMGMVRFQGVALR